MSAASEDGPLPDPLEEARRVIESADERGITVRQIGGTAVRSHAETAGVAPFERAYRDVDFVGTREDEGAIVELMEDLGYESNNRFNTMHRFRLEFYDEANDRKADYCIDRFQFCHEWSLRGRLEADHPTVPIEDLLLSKLQIFEASDRDVRDMVAMLNDHPVEPSDDAEHIDPTYLSALCGRDWGLYKTVSMSLERIDSYVGAHELPIDEPVVHDRVAAIRDELEDRPKTVRWKLRSLIGERKQWYRRPELE